MAVTIDGFVFDAFLSEDHQLDSDVTEYPVESGSDKTDNVRLKQIIVTVEGVVSDTPLTRVSRTEDTLPSDDAYTTLLLIRQLRNPVVIETALTSYENMVMQTLSIPKDSRTGSALRFTAVFKQIEIVINERTIARVSVPIATGKTNLGDRASPSGIPSKNGFVTLPTAEQQPRVITHNGKAAVLDPNTYFGEGPGVKGIGRKQRIPIATGGG